MGTVIQGALQDFCSDVSSRRFPSSEFSPYKISQSETEGFMELLEKNGLSRAAETVHDKLVEIERN